MRIFFIITVFIVVFISIFHIAFQFTETTSAKDYWSGSDVTESELLYHYDKITHIIDQWQEMGRNHSRNDFEEGDKPHILLNIDLSEKKIWLEKNGEVIEPYSLKLSEKFDWSTFLQDPDGNHDLTSPVRAIYPVDQSLRVKPGHIYIVGYTPSGRNIHFNFSSHGKGSGRGSGKVNFGRMQSSWDPDSDKPYATILMSKDEYQSYADTFLSNKEEQSTDPDSHEMNGNTQVWKNIEPILYRELGWMVESLGYRLYEINVKPGPDFNTAHCILRGHKRGIMAIFSSSPSLRRYLQIDHLGDGIWYAKSATHPQWPRQYQDDGYEFLITESGKTPEDKEKWLEQGRQKQEIPTIPKAKQERTLTNGAVVSIIGVSHFPVKENIWWNPDGTLRTSTPPEGYANRPITIRENRNYFQIIYTINKPQSTTDSSTSYSFEDALNTDYRTLKNRYGVVLNDYICSIVSFKKDRETTTFNLCIGINGLEECVEFRNISLIPEKKTDYEIVKTAKK